LVDLFIEQNTGKNKVEPSETELGIRKIMDESLSRMREINEKRMKEWIEQHEWNPDEKEWVLKKK
jgi:hypothetical protein